MRINKASLSEVSKSVSATHSGVKELPKVSWHSNFLNEDDFYGNKTIANDSTSNDNI